MLSLQNTAASNGVGLFDLELDEESSSDELDAYLVTGRQSSVRDPIQYWYSLLPSPLARMALDVLTAPGRWLATCKVVKLG